MKLAVHNNNCRRFIKLEGLPESSKGRKVSFFIPVEKRGSGWLALAESFVRLVRVVMKKTRPRRNLWSGRGEHLEGVSFADVVRGMEKAPVDKAPMK